MPARAGRQALPDNNDDDVAGRELAVVEDAGDEHQVEQQVRTNAFTRQNPAIVEQARLLSERRRHMEEHENQEEGEGEARDTTVEYNDGAQDLTESEGMLYHIFSF